MIVNHGTNLVTNMHRRIVCKRAPASKDSRLSSDSDTQYARKLTYQLINEAKKRIPQPVDLPRTTTVDTATKKRRYYEYVMADKAERAASKKATTGAATKLPAELFEIVVELMARMMYPMPTSLYNQAQIGRAARKMLFTYGIVDSIHPVDVNKRAEAENEDGKTVRTYLQRAEDAIVKQCYITVTSQLSGSVPPLPDSIKHHLRHLHIKVDIPKGAWEHYPVAVYKLQDQLPSVKDLYPMLKTIAVEVEMPASRGRWRKRGFGGGLTSIADELEKVVASLRKTEAMEAYFWYWEADGMWLGGETIDMRKDLDDVIVGRAFANPGREIQV